MAEGRDFGYKSSEAEGAIGYELSNLGVCVIFRTMAANSNKATIVTAAAASAAAIAAVGISYLARRSHNTCKDARYNIPAELSNCRYYAQLELAVELAIRAGQNMVHHIDHKGTSAQKSESDLGINTKSNDADFATAVDIANEKLIMEGICAKFPSHKTIGEEAVGTGSIPPLTKEPTWICDPVDGTTNFAHGMPLTCVSIAFCEDGRPVLGVAFAPATQELYIGIKGHGAFRNGQRIRSLTKGETKNLSNAVVCYEFGYARSEASVDKMVGAVKRVLNHGCRSTRSTGCGVLDICYVATGRFDVVYTGIAEEGWKPWDYSAAMVIAEESGCIIRSLIGNPGSKMFDEFCEQGYLVEGSSFNVYSSSMICGVNKTVVEECRRVVLGL